MIALLATVMTVVAVPFLRAQQPVDLELLLAVDVSWSMDLDEQQLQRRNEHSVRMPSGSAKVSAVQHRVLTHQIAALKSSTAR